MLSSIFLTLQLVSLAGTFFLYFTSENSTTQREVITRLYQKTLWKQFRRFIARTLKCAGYKYLQKQCPADPRLDSCLRADWFGAALHAAAGRDH